MDGNGEWMVKAHKHTHSCREEAEKQTRDWVNDYYTIYRTLKVQNTIGEQRDLEPDSGTGSIERTDVDRMDV